MTTTLIINPELKDLLPPLSPRQFAKLESEIRKDGCTTPLTVWGNVIVDGHHRHTICTKHDISFQIVEKTFESMNDAKLWMWQNQNSRRNLSRFQRAETALKMKEVVALQTKERQRGGQGGILLPQNSAEAKETRQILAEFAEVSHDTLDRVEFLLKHADAETLNRLRWDKKETSINKEFTRIKAELDAQKPKKEKKARSKKSTSSTEEARPQNDSHEAQTASSETKTKEAKKTTTNADRDQEHETDTQQAKSSEQTTTSTASAETVTTTFKSSTKVPEKYSCGTSFEPDPDDDFFDWITDKEREELFEMRKTCPNRLVPQIHNFTIQNIPEHTPEPLLSCLYFLFKTKYREKLAYGLLRRIFAEDDPELARTIVSNLQNEFQNQ